MSESKMDFLKRKRDPTPPSEEVTPNFFRKKENNNIANNPIEKTTPISSEPTKNNWKIWWLYGWQNSWGKWLWIKFYYWIWFIVTFILLIIPLYNIFIGFWNTPWIFTQIYNGISYDWSSQLSDFSVAKSIIVWILGSIVIFFILFAKWESIDSWIDYALLKTSYALEEISKNKNIKKTNPDKYSSLKIQFLVYSGVLLSIFVIYYVLINNIYSLIIEQNITIVSLIWIFIQAIVIIGINTFLVKMFDEKDPTPKIKWRKFIFSEEQQRIINSKTQINNTAGIVIAILLLLLNMVAIWVSQQISQYTQWKIENSEYWTILEWDWGSLDNVLNN